jgi:hypothetical protein
MSQINYTPEQRKRAYQDLIESCYNRDHLPRLLEKAAKLYGVLKTTDLTDLLKQKRAKKY